MASEIFPSEVLEQLSRQMDARLNELAAGDQTAKVKWIRKGRQPVPMPEKELKDVEKAAAEAGLTPESFWRRFQKAARADVCQEGGVLYKQWQRFGDLSNEKVLKQFGAILVAMGFSGNLLQVVALACGVAVVHIGVKAYCMEAEEGGKDGEK